MLAKPLYRAPMADITGKVTPALVRAGVTMDKLTIARHCPDFLANVILSSWATAANPGKAL